MSAALIPALGAIIVALISVLVTNRRLSGKVATSDASSLWEESAAMRKEYRDQINDDRIRIASLEQRISEAERINNALTRENNRLSAQNATYEITIKSLRDRVELLEHENKDLRKKIKELVQREQKG